MASSALLGVGLIASPAMAADGIKLGVGGFFKTAYMMNFDDDSEGDLGNERNTDGFFNDADFDLQLALFRPDVGVVTTIGSEHVASYGSLDGVAREKSKLVRSLPPNGTAVLNADDPRVLAMRAEFQGRTLTFGTSDAATVRASAVASSWPHRLSFTVEWNG